MATHKSAIKRHRQGEKRETHNRWWKSRVRTATKKVLDAVESKKKDEAAGALKEAMGEIDKACREGVIAQNTASRKIARLSARVSSL